MIFSSDNENAACPVLAYAWPEAIGTDWGFGSGKIRLIPWEMISNL